MDMPHTRTKAPICPYHGSLLSEISTLLAYRCPLCAALTTNHRLRTANCERHLAGGAPRPAAGGGGAASGLSDVARIVKRTRGPWGVWSTWLSRISTGFFKQALASRVATKSDSALSEVVRPASVKALSRCPIDTSHIRSGSALLTSSR